MRILVITFNVNKNTTSYRVIKENKLKAKWSKNVKKKYTGYMLIYLHLITKLQVKTIILFKLSCLIDYSLTSIRRVNIIITKTGKHLLLYDDGLILINVEVCFKTAIVCRLITYIDSQIERVNYLFNMNLE